MFRYYTNIVSQATRNLARGTLMTGLSLIGFGILIILLPAVFIFIAAGLFFFAGLGVIATAVKMFLAQRKMDRLNQDEAGAYRKNVRIHIEGRDEDF